MNLDKLRFEDLCDDLPSINYGKLTNNELIKIGKAIAQAGLACGREMAIRNISTLDEVKK